MSWTYGELKAELEKLGVVDADEIAWIDIEGSWPIEVTRDGGRVEVHCAESIE